MGNPDLAGMQTPLDTTLLNAQVEVNQRTQAETSRRAMEYRICIARLNELHQDIRNEYIRPNVSNRPSEAGQMMGRAIGLSMTLKSLLRLATNMTHRAQIEADIGQLLSDRYILESVLLRANIPYTIPPEAMFLPSAPSPLSNAQPTTHQMPTNRNGVKMHHPL